MTEPKTKLRRAADENPSLRERGIYLLPNLFTTAALFAGFFAIVQAMNHKFELAAVAIFIAMVMDGLDGRVARMTNTTSAFGAEYDSLSDMVSFGVAPALIMYVWALAPLKKLGWIAAFLYCACAALRLARFNTKLDDAHQDKRYFQGLPSPAAAALVAGFIWLMTDLDITAASAKWTMFACTLLSGLTMVTNVPYYSFKDINFKKSVPFIVVVGIALGIAIINIDPPTVLFGIFVAYGISGYVVYAYRKAKGMQTSVIATSKDEPEERGLH